MKTAEQTIAQRARPEHPGAVLREIILPAAGLTQTALAERLGVSRRTLQLILQEQRPVTVDLAQRLARAFGNSPQFWLNMQLALDLWDTQHRHQAEYERIRPLERKAA